MIRIQYNMKWSISRILIFLFPMFFLSVNGFFDASFAQRKAQVERRFFYEKIIEERYIDGRFRTQEERERLRKALRDTLDRIFTNPKVNDYTEKEIKERVKSDFIEAVNRQFPNDPAIDDIKSAFDETEPRTNGLRFDLIKSRRVSTILLYNHQLEIEYEIRKLAKGIPKTTCLTIWNAGINDDVLINIYNGPERACANIHIPKHRNVYEYLRENQVNLHSKIENERVLVIDTGKHDRELLKEVLKSKNVLFAEQESRDIHSDNIKREPRSVLGGFERTFNNCEIAQKTSIKSFNLEIYNLLPTDKQQADLMGLDAWTKDEIKKLQLSIRSRIKEKQLNNTIVTNTSEWKNAKDKRQKFLEFLKGSKKDPEERQLKIIITGGHSEHSGKESKTYLRLPDGSSISSQDIREIPGNKPLKNTIIIHCTCGGAAQKDQITFSEACLERGVLSFVAPPGLLDVTMLSAILEAIKDAREKDMNVLDFNRHIEKETGVTLIRTVNRKIKGGFHSSRNLTQGGEKRRG